jgi:hypothetical protein
MSALADIYIKVDTLKTLLSTLESKGEKGIAITINIDDEANSYDQNLTGWISQTKEQREAKKNKFYVGNGKVFWTDGKIVTAKNATKKESSPNNKSSQADDDNLPF